MVMAMDEEHFPVRRGRGMERSTEVMGFGFCGKRLIRPQIIDFIAKGS
jgi:hypothetical protein